MRAGRWLVIVGLLLACSAHASEPLPLEGTWMIAGRTLVDPPPDEATDSHLYLFLEGEAARALYDALAVEAEEDLCLGDGSRTKTLGGTACVRRAEDGSFECTLGIALDRQMVDANTPC